MIEKNLEVSQVKYGKVLVQLETCREEAEEPLLRPQDMEKALMGIDPC